MKTILSFLTLTLGLLLAAGCASTESRIKQNPAAFARLTPEEQQLIKEGKVAIGFDQEMVRLALGDADRIRERTDASGKSEVWDYITYEDNRGMMLYRGWYHRGWRDPYYPYYLDAGSRRERAKDRVTFKDGKVVSIEQEKR